MRALVTRLREGIRASSTVSRDHRAVVGVLLGAILTLLGGALGAVYAGVLEERAARRRREEANTAAIDVAVEMLLNASSDVTMLGAWVGAVWHETKKQHLDDTIPVREALQRTSHALDRLRLVAPVDVQEPASGIFDATINYFQALTSFGDLNELDNRVRSLHLARMQLLSAIGREVLPDTEPPPTQLFP